MTHIPSLHKDSCNHDITPDVESRIPSPSGGKENRVKQRSEILNVLFSYFKDNLKYDTLTKPEMVQF